MTLASLFAVLEFTALVLVLLLALPPAASSTPRAAAATPAPERWVTDGSVITTALVGNTLYLGGDFTSVGPPTGSLVALDATTGAHDSAFPRFNGVVRAVVAAGAGGWFVGGDFTAVNGWAHAYLAHLRADYTPDLTWAPPLDGPVRSLVVSDSMLYVVGRGFYANYLARLDARSGASIWKVTRPGGVTALATRGRMLYLGYDSIRSISALDIATGADTSWETDTAVQVSVITVSGNTLYAGHAYGLAAFNATTGQRIDWNPNANADVQALALNGNTLYVGGEFTQVGGQARRHLAALDATSGAVTPWNPNPDGPVAALAVTGSTVYVGGDFTHIGGQARNRLAALDATNGAASAWNPNANGFVSTLATSGNRVYAGGEFTGVGGVARSNLAALDLTTGAATPWNPNGDKAVYTLAASGGYLYAGGSFTSAGGIPRRYLAELEATNGSVTSRNFAPPMSRYTRLP